jgi:hypothetical protein
MEEQSMKFLKYEKLFHRIQVTIFLTSIGIYLLFLAIIESLGAFVDVLVSVMLVGIIVSAITFILSVLRILKYIFKHRSVLGATIWRSFLNLILSPLSIIIFYILIFITAATSCAYGG